MTTRANSIPAFDQARFDPPRWKGGPLICIAANRPALETLSKLRAFTASNGTLCTLVKEWQCESCGWFHAETLAPDPAGASCGNGRSSKALA